MLPQFLQDITSAAPASRDAKYCVSRADTAYFHRHTSAPPYSAKFPRETQNLASLLYLYKLSLAHILTAISRKDPRETQDFASLLYLHTLSLANIHTAISRKANSGDARFCVSTLFAHTFIGKHMHCHIAQS